MKKRLERSAIGYRLSKEEFTEMVKQSSKGIISLKANRNDHITELALLVEFLFMAQFGTISDNLSQSKMSNYQEAQELALECIEKIKPFAKKMEQQRDKRKPKRQENRNVKNNETSKDFEKMMQGGGDIGGQDEKI